MQALYDALLEARIRLQHSVAAAPRIPPAAVFTALGASQPRLRAAAAALRAELAALVCDLLRLRQAVAEANPEVAESLARGGAPAADASAPTPGMRLPPGIPPLGSSVAAAASGKRRRPSSEDEDGPAGEEGRVSVPSTAAAALASDELWASLHDGWEAAAAFRDATLDKWGRRMLLAQVRTAGAEGLLSPATTPPELNSFFCVCRASRRSMLVASKHSTRVWRSK